MLFVAHDSDPARVALWLIEGGSAVRRYRIPADAPGRIAESVEALLATDTGLPDSGDVSVTNRIDRWLIANADDPNVIWIDSRPEKVQVRVRRAVRRLGLGAGLR